MKKSLLLLLSIISLSTLTLATSNSFACGQAFPDTDPHFCSSFKEVAICHCVGAGLPRAACQNMHTLYSRMIGMFGSLERACAFQKDTSTQACIDDWKCYLNGNEDSAGRLCSGTGFTCE
ncbi:MAG: hypothetical protein P4M14_00165 [Gammaproteobacteria bacterium]|nr:hypothetical protein [Gammaproteobacteria bacterium]